MLTNTVVGLGAVTVIIFGGHTYQPSPQLAGSEAAVATPWYFNQLHVQHIWDTYGTGSPNVIVAVIDDGIDVSNPELKGNIWTKADADIVADPRYDGTYVHDTNGWNFIHDIIQDPVGQHGTFVGGIIAGHGEVPIGIAPSVQLMPLVVCNGAGNCSVPAIARAIYFAVQNGAQVINISLVTKPEKGFASELDEAIKYAWDKGVVVVAAAGNSPGATVPGALLKSSHLLSPVCNSKSIGVGASTEAGKIASWSNHGSRCVDLYAPGEYVTSLIAGGASSTDLFRAASGTSFSAAIVSSLCAILKSAHPEMTNVQIRERIDNAGPILNAMKVFAPPDIKAAKLTPTPEKKSTSVIGTSTKKVIEMLGRLESVFAPGH